MNVSRGDVAIVVDGLVPNVGHLVYVDKFMPSFRFWTMGLGTMDGWRVRSLGATGLLTTRGARMSGICPDAFLRRLELSPGRQREIEVEVAKVEFREAMQELVTVYEAADGHEIQGEFEEQVETGASA